MILRIILTIGIGISLIGLVRKVKKGAIKKYEKTIIGVTVCVAFFILCQIPFENLFGFRSVENAFRYEKGTGTNKIEQIIYSPNTAFVIYTQKNRDVSYEIYYQKDDERWCTDKANIDFKWCDYNSVILCQDKKTGEAYILIAPTNEIDCVTDSLNTEFLKVNLSTGQTVFCAEFCKEMEIGYQLIFDNQVYVLQSSVFFEKVNGKTWDDSMSWGK